MKLPSPKNISNFKRFLFSVFLIIVHLLVFLEIIARHLQFIWKELAGG